MPKEENNLGKKRGRPAIGRGVQVNTMFRPDVATALDKYRAEQEGNLSRPEAVRMLVSDALERRGICSGR